MKVKKNDKAYLQDFKIDIRTDKDVLFQELALLFDKPSFINLLPDLRRTYKVTNPYPLEDFDEEFEFNLLNAGEIVKIDLSKYSKIDKLKELFPEYYDFISSGSNAMPEMFDCECNLICYEFDRPTYFVEAIEQAILCSAVNDKYFKPTEAKVVNFGIMGAWPTLDRLAIFISPTSTYEDVKEEFRKARELMKTDKQLSYYQPRTDLTPNIRKYREWYWERVKGKTYQAIADDCSDEDVVTYLNILKAVKIYTKLLSQ